MEHIPYDLLQSLPDSEALHVCLSKPGALVRTIWLLGTTSCSMEVIAFHLQALQIAHRFRAVQVSFSALLSFKYSLFGPLREKATINSESGPC
uniref:ATR1 n=1 Tax=Arundo donax TaxID=35708 RepID=A0A0A8YW46_ARUDO